MAKNRARKKEEKEAKEKRMEELRKENQEIEGRTAAHQQVSRDGLVRGIPVILYGEEASQRWWLIVTASFNELLKAAFMFWWQWFKQHCNQQNSRLW